MPYLLKDRLKTVASTVAFIWIAAVGLWVFLALPLGCADYIIGLFIDEALLGQFLLLVAAVMSGPIVCFGFLSPHPKDMVEKFCGATFGWTLLALIPVTIFWIGYIIFHWITTEEGIVINLTSESDYAKGIFYILVPSFVIGFAVGLLWTLASIFMGKGNDDRHVS